MADIETEILRKARVKLTEMFDSNFNRQGFFDNKWAPTKDPKVNKAGKKGSILIVSGRMRRSIRSYIKAKAIVFASDLPYTALHNEGGNFPVKVRPHKKTRKGKTFNVRSHTKQMSMPQRQFIGDHPKVQQALGDIVHQELQRFSENLVRKTMRK